jgi:hypothetical protein
VGADVQKQSLRDDRLVTFTAVAHDVFRMTDVTTALEEFFEDADRVFGEYDQGYMDADVALDLLEGHIEELREVTEEA